MRIRILAPSPGGGRTGNRVTADRWRDILAELGHDARVEEVPEEETGAPSSRAAEQEPSPAEGTEAGDGTDLVIALHARRSHERLRRFHEEHRDRPLVVALTGTDLYRDLPDDPTARASLEMADRLVVLQERGLTAVPRAHRPRVRIIHQSVPELSDGCADGPVDRAQDDEFRVCLLAHLRPVKDPLRAAEAARRLPPDSRVVVVHCGKGLTEEMTLRARSEEATNPRYRWMGEVPREEALRVLCASRLLVLTSRLEGAGNAISEALAADVPIVCTRVDGLVGMLGPHYPGYFPVGDTGALAELLRRAETVPAFLAELREACRERAPLVEPAREREAWRTLLEELAGDGEGLSGGPAAPER